MRDPRLFYGRPRDESGERGLVLETALALPPGLAGVGRSRTGRDSCVCVRTVCVWDWERVREASFFSRFSLCVQRAAVSHTMRHTDRYVHRMHKASSCYLPRSLLPPRPTAYGIAFSSGHLLTCRRCSGHAGSFFIFLLAAAGLASRAPRLADDLDAR